MPSVPKHGVIRLKGKPYESLQERVLIRDVFTCKVCGCFTLAPPHHVLFRSQGGSDVMGNMTTLCGPNERDCHDGFHKRAECKGKMVGGEFEYWPI